MALRSQETFTMLALDKHQQLVFRIQSMSKGFKLNFIDDALAFGQQMLKLEPDVAFVEVYDRPADKLSSVQPLVIITRDDPYRTGQAAHRDQRPSVSPPRWVSALVRLILESSLAR